jgi:hypothetical protein
MEQTSIQNMIMDAPHYMLQQKMVILIFYTLPILWHFKALFHIARTNYLELFFINNVYTREKNECK